MSTTAAPSTAPTGRTTLHAADYVIFAAMLVGTMVIGIYHAVKARHHASTSDYLVGGRKMGLLPVSISVMVSFISSVMMVGFPAESYTNGGSYWLFAIGIGVGALLSAILFVPVFHPLKLTSVNQYLKKRFHSRFVAILGTLSSVTQMVLYTGVVYFAPATSIEAITGFPTWASILIGSVLAIIYTTIGGIKAVIWTDVFQTLVMVAGLLAVVVQAVMKVGTLSDVWEVCDEWGRLEFNTDPDPTIRFNVWSLTFGVGFMFLNLYGTSQSSVQRYSALPSLPKAMLSVFLALPWTTIMVSLAVTAGLTMFAYYTNLGCDPLQAGFVNSPNQLIPYFVMDTLNYPGIPGLLMAGLSSASLSSASSSLNAAAANIWEDVLLEIWPNMSESRNLLVTKILVVLFGVAAALVGFLVSHLGGIIQQAVITLISSTGGPTTGMFFLGIAFPFANWMGTSVGGFIGFIFALWMGFGSYTIDKHKIYLPTTIANCSRYQSAWRDSLFRTSTQQLTPVFMSTTESTTVFTGITGPTKGPADNPLYNFYAVSYLWIALYSMAVTVIVGVLVSLVTGCMRGKEVNPSHLHPLVRRFNTPITNVFEKPYNGNVKARNKASTSDYLVGGRQMSLLPVSISLMVSFISSIMMLGFPAESYAYGGSYWLYAVGIGIGALLSAIIFVPVFHPLKLTSVNQYLKKRFHSRFVAILGTLGSVTLMVSYTGVVYFAPATAIEAITGFPTWASMVIGSILTIIYTTIGGIKAVIWTDVFQTLVMVAGLLAVTIQAVMKVGTLSDVWEVCYKWGRLEFNTSNDPRIRFNVLSLTVGVGFMFLNLYGTTQSSVQRFSSVPSLPKAMLSVFLALPWTTLMVSLSCMAGLAMFAYYTLLGCDPLQAKYIKSPNQLIPYFVMDTLNYPGIPGLLMAGLSSASLSSASSSLNAAAANIWEDVLLEIWPNMSESRNLLVTKILVVIFGIVAMCVGILVSQLGGTVMQVVVTLVSSCGGPTTGMFFLGIAFPFANWMGTSVGGFAGFIFAVWMGFGGYTIEKHNAYLPTTVANCSMYQSAWRDSLLGPSTQPITTFTESTMVFAGITEPPQASAENPLHNLYAVSYLWIGLYSMGVTVFVGILGSLVTGCMRGKRVDPSHLHPLVRRFATPDTNVDEKLYEENNVIQNGTTKVALDNPAFTNGYGVTLQGYDQGIIECTKC